MAGINDLFDGDKKRSLGDLDINELKKNTDLVKQFGFIVLFLLALLCITSSCSSKDHKLKRCIKESKLEYKDWQEAILHYNFENAYSLVTCYKSLDYYSSETIKEIIGKIAETEVSYLLSEGYISRGLEIARENNTNISDEGVTDDELLEIIYNSYKILIDKKRFNEAYLLFRQIPFKAEPPQDYYIFDTYSNEARDYNHSINLLLDKLLFENVMDFNYSDLLDLYKPIAHAGKLIETGNVSRKVKTGEKVVVDNKGRVQKDQLGRIIKEETFEYRTEKRNYYGVVFSEEDKETAVRRIKSKGIIIK